MNILRKIREVDRALNEGLITYQEAADMVAPFTDAEPVRHGHWIDTGSGQECSECHEIQPGYDNYRYYCPVCGAKMDEVVKDG